MAIDLQKINIKFYLAEDTVLSPEDAFRIFSQWIPETPDETLIDVADYQHVPQGPKTVLVGHEANYSFDNTDGRYGLLYRQKAAASGPNTDRLKSALVATLRACDRLERGADATAKARFVGAEAVVVINDRLCAANDDDALDEIRGDLDAVLDQLYAGASTQIQREGDELQRLSIRVRAEGDFDTQALLSNLDV
ncbi:MAG TPA: hypothetical protein QGF95_20615 [Candidatus Latescibacteria bacterium]|jgi:hypothetical protein|nr:hypothetical protein [Gemmatimonadaceae bacterium]MDP6018387.1 hypothetical protein [Candidatus Latescibacterota bacterium]HJP32958.1 hypothetical protein [Candidatus Latescibacterota bacterium]|tara:strand:+ start:220 stop:801 length:582 start_codon:yes stop_codon:yes gene_type:complete